MEKSSSKRLQNSEIKEFMESLIYAADENKEIRYSSIASLFDVGNNTITRKHPLWGPFQVSQEYKEHREWKREKYNTDPIWRRRLLDRNNDYFKERYHSDEDFRNAALDKFNKWIRGSTGQEYRASVQRRYKEDEVYRNFLLNKKKESYKRKDPLMKFLMNVDLQDEKDVNLGKSFPVSAFEVLLLLSDDSKMSSLKISRRVGKRDAQTNKGIIHNMRYSDLIEPCGTGVRYKYHLSEYGWETFNYLARNIPGDIDLHLYPIIKRPRIRV